MKIVGYKGNVNKSNGIKAITKHTGMPSFEARKIISNAMNGEVIELETDYILLEDLEDSGFIVS